MIGLKLEIVPSLNDVLNIFHAYLTPTYRTDSRVLNKHIDMLSMQVVFSPTVTFIINTIISKKSMKNVKFHPR